MLMKIFKDENCYGSFSLSNLFVSDYLAELSGDAVKLYVYLCWLYEMHRDTTQSALITALKISEERVKNAVEELCGAGIVNTSDGYIGLADIAALKFMRKTGLGGNESAAWFTGENRQENSELSDVINTVQRDYFGGRMTRQWYELIRRLSNKLEPEVVLLLFAHCEQYCGKPLKKAYVEKVAESWISENIRNAKELEEYLGMRSVLSKLVDYIRKKMNRSAPFMDSEIAIIKKWRFEYGYGEDELSFVLDWTKFNNPTIGAFDKILTAWHSLGLKNAEDIKAYLEKNQAAAAGKETRKSDGSRGKNSGTLSARANFSQREYTEDFYASLLSGKSDIAAEDTDETNTED